MASMVLKASTNVYGSTCECDLGYTPEEWHKMSEEEQLAVMREYQSNIVDLWVEESE